MVQVDVNRIVQVISNLLRSALKHGTRGGKIIVQATEKGTMVELKISHGGQGFTAEQLKNLFVGSKTPGEPNGSMDGLRIGLAIAREIVLAHGGDIGVESRGLEQGSTFWIKLPIMREQPLKVV